MTEQSSQPTQSLRVQDDFVVTEHLNKIISRALAYLDAGFPIHFQGPSGTGKTSLALYLAHCLKHPVMLIHGDHEMNSSDMVGGLMGFRVRFLIDNFVHSVLKREEDVERSWMDGRLTTACQEGMTLVYDEFTRSHPEANNILLSVLEEKVLQLPGLKPGEKSIKVNPNFRAIFTSNPEEYAGVFKSQDALRDRMITIELGQMDLETEAAITASRSGLTVQQAVVVVNIVRLFSAAFPGFTTALRRSVIIATIIKQENIPVNSELFGEVCLDVLGAELNRRNGNRVNHGALQNKLNEVIKQVVNE
ncbi:MAG: gas vesicle protein GvpN [Thermacetogeniaceae bacterium]